MLTITAYCGCACIFADVLLLLLSANDPPFVVLAGGARVEGSVG